MARNGETDTMNRILLALSREFIGRSFWWRQNAGEVETATGARQTLGPPGIADIMGCLDGRAVAIEVKQPKGKQRDTQKRFQEAWERAGGIYLLARSPDAAVASLRAYQEQWHG